MKLHRHPGTVAVATLAAGLVLAGLAALWQARDNAAVAAARFDALAAKVVAQVADRLKLYEYGLRSTRSAVVIAGIRHVDRSTYRRYSESRDIGREYPGASGFGMMRRVAPGDEAAFIAAARRDGWPEFGVHQLEPHAGERYVIQYAEPIERNALSIGADMASEPGRRAAAELAMRSGDAVLTSPITFKVPGAPVRRSFLLFLPIYEPGRPLTTVQAREAATFGWTFARLTIDDVLEGFDFDGGAFTLALRDRSDTGLVQFFASPGSEAPAAAGLSRLVDFPAHGRVWAAELRAQPRFIEALNQRDPSAVAAGGALLAALLAALLYAHARGTQRDLQLRDEQALRAAMVDSASDAIISVSLAGIVIDWNRAAERLFGHPAQAAIGQSVASLLLPPGCEQEDATLRDRIAQGEAVPPFDAVRRAADGTLLDVSIAASPVRAADGRIVGLAKTLRDVQPAKAAERRVLEHNAVLERQVSERTASLESARHDLQAVLDALPSTIGYWGRDLRNRFANQAHRHWYGIAPEDVRGRTLLELLGEATFERCRPHIEAALRGEPQRFERHHHLPDGGLRHALVQYMPDTLGDGVPGFYVLVHDITDQTQDKARLAAALRENDALLRTVQMHAIVSVADRSGCIIDVNRAFCGISGYSREELIGQNHRILNSGAHDAGFWAGMWATIAHGEPWRHEICSRARDGSLYWTDSMISPMLGDDGQVEKYVSIRFDITAAKRAEQHLRASEALLDRAGRAAGVGCWELDLRTQAVTWSEQTCRLHEVEPGYTPRLEGALDFYTPDSRATIERAVAQSMAEGVGWDHELPLVTAKGRAIWVRAVGAVEFEQGEPVRLVGAFQDITSRKQAELLLQQSHERFSLAADAAGIGVWDWDIDADTLVWDDRMYRLYGRSAGHGAGPYALWADNLHPDDRERTEAELQRGVSGAQAFDTEFRILWPDGEVRHLKAVARVQSDAGGTARRMIGVNFDITERKRAGLALLETSSLLHSVLDAASEVSIIATAPDFTIKVFNRGAQLLLGYRAEELVDRATPAVLHDPAELDARAVALSAELGRPVSGIGIFTEPSTLRQAQPCTYLCKDGRRVSVSLVITAIRDSAGKALGYLGIAHDVTRQQKLESSLRHATHKAEQANLAKSRFLACMSHEIRTPMNAVLGLAYLLERTALDAEQLGMLRKMQRAGKSLLRMVNDSLDIAKIEAGQLQVVREAFCLSDLLGHLAGLARVQSDARGVGFALEQPASLPAWLEGDALRLEQVLSNLTSNAIKFTHRGGVRLVVRELPGAPEHTTLRFEVHDTGIGISSDDARHLFLPFSQGDASISRRFGGTGLGLSIAKQVTELMGGRIGLHSTPGVGSEFWVEIGFAHAPPPATQPWQETAQPAAGRRRLQDVRVLIVDDSDINLEVARRILGLEGAVASLAASGSEAVDCLRLRPRDFDAVLMDVQMPGIDGFEATRRIRTELGLHALPVIGLTAGTLNSQRAQALEAGMNDFMGKPLEPHELVACIRRHLGIRDAVPLAPEADAPACATPPAVAAWPEIAGIVTADVAVRLDGDAVLFRSMLSRLLDEFASPPGFQAGDDSAWPGLGPRLHKLAGSAANLGAKTIAALAARGEQACAEGHRPLAEQLAQRLDEQLQALARHAAAFLNEAPLDRPPRDDLATDPLSAQALARLIELLRQQQASAVAQFERVSPGLRQWLGSERYALVEGHVDNLRFAEAERELAVASPP